MRKVRRISAGEYTVYVDGKHVANISKTGTHLDYYPWDWWLEGTAVSGRKPTGTADTKRDALDQVAYSLGMRYGWMER